MSVLNAPPLSRSPSSRLGDHISDPVIFFYHSDSLSNGMDRGVNVINYNQAQHQALERLFIDITLFFNYTGHNTLRCEKRENTT